MQVIDSSVINAKSHSTPPAPAHPAPLLITGGPSSPDLLESGEAYKHVDPVDPIANLPVSVSALPTIDKTAVMVNIVSVSSAVVLIDSVLLSMFVITVLNEVAPTVTVPAVQA